MSAQTRTTFPRAINHIAVACTDIDALVPWWQEVLGFELISPVRRFTRESEPDAFKYIFCSYPPEMSEVKLAILTSGNGVAIEVFEFVRPAMVQTRNDPFDFVRPGVFHICITDPHPEALVAKVVARGGKQVGGYMDYARIGIPGERGIYMQDPWGNVVECMSLGLDRVASVTKALALYKESEESL